MPKFILYRSYNYVICKYIHISTLQTTMGFNWIGNVNIRLQFSICSSNFIPSWCHCYNLK